MTWCGPEVEVEGIVSLKTGGCPEDCHFCSQSGQFTSPVRSVWLDIPRAGQGRRGRPRATGATEFCIVAAVRGPDERLMTPDARGRQGDPGRGRHQRRRARSACSPRSRSTTSPTMGVHRYNHNLEAARSYFPQRGDHALLGGALGHLRDGPRVRHGAVLRRPRRHGRDARAARRARRPARPSSSPHEVPLNFLNPRPGTPFGDLPVMDGQRRAAHHRRVPAGDAAHDPAVRRRARAHPRRPRHPRRPARRHQRGHRRQLPDHAGPRPRARTSTLLADLKMPIKALTETL